jgi:hypothetical protein
MKSPAMIGNIEHRYLWQLKAYPHNARTHSDSQIDQIAKSIREFGFVNPLLVAPDDTIIAGHARLKAASRVGVTAVPVIVLKHLSDAQRRALVIADNQLALNAGWDETLLRAELAALEEEKLDLDVIGFDAEELARLIAEEERRAEDELAELTHPETASETVEGPVTRPGDVWILGPHRLRCGDEATEKELEYADVICRKWQELTSVPAVLGADKTTFAETAAGRHARNSIEAKINDND